MERMWRSWNVMTAVRVDGRTGQGSAHHGSVGCRSTPLTLSDLCENFRYKYAHVR